MQGIDGNKRKSFSDTSLTLVKSFLGNNTIIRQGYFPDSIVMEDMENKYAFVSLDCDLYNPTLAGLKFFYPRLSADGMIFCHDYSSGNWEGVKKAVDMFCEENNINIILLPDIGGTAIIVKA